MKNVSDLISKLKNRDENSQFNLIKNKTNGQLISCLKALII